MQRSKVNPAQLVGLSFLGVLIICGVFLGMSGPYQKIPDGWNGLFARLAAPIAIGCGGFYLIIWAQNRLKNGIRSDGWTDAELRPVREFFESRVAKTATGILICTGLVLILIDFFYPHHGFGIGFWMCFLLQNRFQSFSLILKAPGVSQPQLRLEPSAPLQSEHWGK